MKKTLIAGETSQQGYTVVEAMIVLVVIGILLGTSLYPLGQRLRVEKIETTKEQLESIQDAILGYAYSSRTSRAGIRLGTDGEIAVVPEGRPFLPCPDVTGDGVEDRWPGDSAELSLQNYQRPVYVDRYWRQFSLGILEESDRWKPELLLSFQITIGIDRADNPLLADSKEPMFVCVSDRGNVPWTTLGTPPMDLWGNRFTYRVDPIFSNGVIGFGRESRSDVFDPRLPIIATVDIANSSGEIGLYQRRVLDKSFSVAATLSLAHSTVTFTTNHNDAPGVICLTLVGANGCVRSNDAGKALIIGPNYVNPYALSSLTVFDNTQIATVARVYEPLDFSSGMAFVILSHGADAAGAVIHNDGLNSMHRATSATVRLSCIAGFPDSFAADRPEDENADSINLCPTSYPTTLTDAATPRTHSFVELPIFNSGNNQSSFDDILIYMSDRSVIQSMSQLGVKFDQIYHPPRAL